jgi:hypothetical protein
VFITATRAFIKKGPGLIDERDFTRTGIKSQQQLPAKVRINGALVKALYANVKRTLMVVLPFLIVPFLFVVQLVGSLVYSLLGLLLNLFRKNKLSYGAIFGLTCFATSTGLMLVWFKAMLPFSQTPLPFLVHVLTNVIYMIVAFKVTDQEPAKA